LQPHLVLMTCVIAGVGMLPAALALEGLVTQREGRAFMERCNMTDATNTCAGKVKGAAPAFGRREMSPGLCRSLQFATLSALTVARRSPPHATSSS
jgi:hypothetical protein